MALNKWFLALYFYWKVWFVPCCALFLCQAGIHKFQRIANTVPLGVQYCTMKETQLMANLLPRLNLMSLFLFVSLEQLKMKVSSCKVATNQIISMQAIWLLVLVMCTWWKHCKILKSRLNDGSLMRLMIFPCVCSHISATRASRNRIINAGFLHRKRWSSRTWTLGRMRRVSGNFLMNPGLRTSWTTRGSLWNRRTSCPFLQVQEKVPKMFWILLKANVWVTQLNMQILACV